jgi:hypothetical protein
MMEPIVSQNDTGAAADAAAAKAAADKTAADAAAADKALADKATADAAASAKAVADKALADKAAADKALADKAAADKALSDKINAITTLHVSDRQKLLHGRIDELVGMNRLSPGAANILKNSIDKDATRCILAAEHAGGPIPAFVDGVFKALSENVPMPPTMPKGNVLTDPHTTLAHNPVGDYFDSLKPKS